MTENQLSMLTVIEGLDGSGKSTQVRKLKKYLESISEWNISISQDMMLLFMETL